jgi:hypothetical protein
MRGVVTNPKKTFRFGRPMKEVTFAVEYLPLFTNAYKLIKANRVLHQFTYEATGIYLDINIFFGNEAQTEITIEVRQIVNSFDPRYDITDRDSHIATIAELITESINAGIKGRQAILDEFEINKKMKTRLAEEKKSRKLEQKQNFLIQLNKKHAFGWILVLSFILGIGYLIYKLLFL